LDGRFTPEQAWTLTGGVPRLMTELANAPKEDSYSIIYSEWAAEAKVVIAVYMREKEKEGGYAHDVARTALAGIANRRHVLLKAVKTSGAYDRGLFYVAREPDVGTTIRPVNPLLERAAVEAYWATAGVKSLDGLVRHDTFCFVLAY
jgi:hypothetical protein